MVRPSENGTRDSTCCIDWLAHHQSIGNVVLVWQCSSLFYLMVDCRQTIEKVRTKRSFFLSRLQRTLYVLYMLDLKANIWTMCDMHVVSKWWCGTRISTFPFRPPNSYRKRKPIALLRIPLNWGWQLSPDFLFYIPPPLTCFPFLRIGEMRRVLLRWSSSSLRQKGGKRRTTYDTVRHVFLNTLCGIAGPLTLPHILPSFFLVLHVIFHNNKTTENLNGISGGDPHSECIRTKGGHCIYWFLP